MGGFSVWGNATHERQFHLADREVARVDDLGSDVNAVLELERDQVGLAILDFIKGGLFAGSAPDVRKHFIVIHGRDQKRFARRFRVEGIIELEFSWRKSIGSGTRT